MANILKGICRNTPILEGIDDWPRSASKKEWFRITRDLIQSVIADMDLDPASLSQVEEAFLSAGLLRKVALEVAPFMQQWLRIAVIVKSHVIPLMLHRLSAGLLATAAFVAALAATA